MFVRCKAGCLWLPLEGEVLDPPMSEEGLTHISEVLRGMELKRSGGIGPPEGGAANESDTDSLPF